MKLETLPPFAREIIEIQGNLMPCTKSAARLSRFRWLAISNNASLASRNLFDTGSCIAGQWGTVRLHEATKKA